MTKTLLDIEVDKPLIAKYHRGATNRLIVVFSGVGQWRRLPPDVEFHDTAIGPDDNHVLFIIDDSRSWLNTPGIDEQIQRIVEDTLLKSGAGEVHFLGNSMGATMALFMADMIEPKSVLAMVPQYSIDPEIVPEEKRWRVFRNKIENIKYKSVYLNNARKSQINIIHGGTPDELFHALRFPKFESVNHYIYPEFGHWITKALKDGGHLKPLVRAAYSNRPRLLRRIVLKSGGMRVDDFRRDYSGLVNTVPGLREES